MARRCHNAQETYTCFRLHPGDGRLGQEERCPGCEGARLGMAHRPPMIPVDPAGDRTAFVAEPDPVRLELHFDRLVANGQNGNYAAAIDDVQVPATRKWMGSGVGDQRLLGCTEGRLVPGDWIPQTLGKQRVVIASALAQLGEGDAA